MYFAKYVPFFLFFYLLSFSLFCNRTRAHIAGKQRQSHVKTRFLSSHGGDPCLPNKPSVVIAHMYTNSKIQSLLFIFIIIKSNTMKIQLIIQPTFNSTGVPSHPTPKSFIPSSSSPSLGTSRPDQTRPDRVYN